MRFLLKLLIVCSLCGCTTTPSTRIAGINQYARLHLWTSSDGKTKIFKKTTKYCETLDGVETENCYQKICEVSIAGGKCTEEGDTTIRDQKLGPDELAEINQPSEYFTPSGCKNDLTTCIKVLRNLSLIESPETENVEKRICRFKNIKCRKKKFWSESELIPETDKSLLFRRLSAESELHRRMGYFTAHDIILIVSPTTSK